MAVVLPSSLSPRSIAAFSAAERTARFGSGLFPALGARTSARVTRPSACFADGTLPVWFKTDRGWRDQALYEAGSAGSGAGDWRVAAAVTGGMAASRSVWSGCPAAGEVVANGEESPLGRVNSDGRKSATATDIATMAAATAMMSLSVRDCGFLRRLRGFADTSFKPMSACLGVSCCRSSNTIRSSRLTTTELSPEFSACGGRGAGACCSARRSSSPTTREGPASLFGRAGARGSRRSPSRRWSRT